MEETQKSGLLELVIVEGEKNALLAALKVCRGDQPLVFEGWKEESKLEWIERLLGTIENIQLQYGCPWFPEQMSGVYAGKLAFIKDLKPFLVDVLTLYVSGFPNKYEGVDSWEDEAIILIRRLAPS